MISADRAFDRAAIRSFIVDHGLDPVPTLDTRSLARDGVQLTVETYGWGRVCYAEWKARDVGLTWVEREGGRPTLPAWAEAIRALLERPECLGHHEDDHVCDGGVNPTTKQREPACRWRTVCLYAQTLGHGKASALAAVLESTDEELWDRAEATAKEERKVPPERVARAVEAVRRSHAANLASSRELVDVIARRVCERGQWEFQDARWRATIGQFYLVEHPRDRSGRNPIVVLFRRRPRSWTGELARDSTTEQSIARFLPHSVHPTCSVQIRTDAMEVVREACPDLPANRAAMGRHKELVMVTIRGVGAEHVDQVAEAIVRVINGNLLAAWGVGALDPDKPGFDPSKVRTRRRKVA